MDKDTVDKIVTEVKQVAEVASAVDPKDAALIAKVAPVADAVEAIATTKNWWESKTIWGVIIMAASPVINKVLHITLTEDTQNTLVTQIVDIIQHLELAIGGGVAIYGRVKAAGPIK